MADCIEAGLPYDWDRINIASDTEKEIVRALLEVVNSKAAAPAAAAAVAVAAATTSATATTEALAAAKAGGAVAARAPEGVHVENVMPDDTRSTLVSKHDSKHDGIQGVTSGRCPNGAIGASVAHAGVCGAVAAVAPAEDSVKRQRRLVDSCGWLGVGCVMTDGLSRANCLGHSQGERGGGVGTGAGKYSGRWQRQGDGRDSDPGKVGTTIRDGAEEVEANATRRWDYVGLREVRDLAPGVEYWQIRMVLAKFKSGWCECPGSE